jgi:predicted ferric reductase
MIALAGKANIITILTGYSHEKLNVFHRWTAWITFVLSLIHTIPFFVASLRMGQARGESGYKSVVDEFYRDANPSEVCDVSLKIFTC